MKRSDTPGALALLFLACCGQQAGADEIESGLGRSIKNTPHNLSRSGKSVGNTVVVEGTSQICIFCHTPHTAKPASPLWNRDSVGVTYKLYGSSTMKGMPAQPTGRSKLCLSCHDGTVAVTAVRRKPKGLDAFDAHGIAGTKLRLVGRPTSLGTDLSDDHPIIIDYDEASLQNAELAPRKSLPREFRLTHDPTVHCTTCHDAHRNDRPPFLVKDNTQSRLCTTCHLKKGWKDAIHRTSTARWNGRGENPFHLSSRRSGGPTVAANGCESCHKPHGASKAERLLKGSEERLCFKCHNGNVAKVDIEREFGLPYGHHVERFIGVHDAYENIDTFGRILDGRDNDNSTRHVECSDCHNPHVARAGKHRPGTNQVSGALLGVSGVKLVYGAAKWVPPSFRWVPANPGVSHEYELCMKCHSSWIWESVPPTTTDGTTQTDPSVEFNPNNASFHAVIGESRASTFGDYVPPWNSRSKMYCSDCHRGDGAGSSAGAHGSRVRFLLAGNYDRTTGALGTEGHLCFSCHRFSTYADPRSIRNWRKTGFATRDRRNLHALHAGKRRTDTGRTGVCQDCHAARPHGLAKNKALIVLTSDPPPYRDKYAGIVRIGLWPPPQAWENGKTGNCLTTPGCHGVTKKSPRPFKTFSPQQKKRRHPIPKSLERRGWRKR